MKKYPICAVKELCATDLMAMDELKSLSTWEVWNVIKINNIKNSKCTIDLGIDKPTVFPTMQFVLTKSQHENELLLIGNLSSKDQLIIEWTITINSNHSEHLLINTILLSGSWAGIYYAQYGQALTQVLKQMNRSFAAYIRSKIRSEDWFGDEDLGCPIFL